MLLYIASDGSSSKYMHFGNGKSSKDGRETVEFSFMIPTGSEGITVSAGITTPGVGSNNRTEKNFSILNSGFYSGSTGSSGVKLADIKADQWYNMAITYPGATEFDSAGNPTAYDRNIYVYLNGEQIRKEEVASATNYFFFRFNPRSSKPIYFDNARRLKGATASDLAEAYVPAYDKAPTITTHLPVEDDKIYLNNADLTVEYLLSTIEVPAAFKANMRVYDANWNLLDSDDAVLTGSKLVIAAKNGTEIERAFSYYDIINADSRYFKVFKPTATVADGTVNGSVIMLNHTGAAQTVTAIIAVYEGNELVQCVPVTYTMPENMTMKQITANTDGFTASARETDKVKIMVWNNIESDITPVIPDVEIQ